MPDRSHPEYLNPRVSERRPMVTVGPELLDDFPRFSLYNSPYAAHDEGCAIDLYPHEGDWREGSELREASEGRDADRARETAAPSPVAGEVVAARTVSAPSKAYAESDDHLVVVDTGEYLARMLHVEPAVEPGDEVARGDSLGEMIRSGFFAPWVDNHVHLGFRDRDADPVRASGSLPVELAPEVELAAVPWDGRGTVVAAGDTYAVLDAPDHPAPGEAFAGIAARRGDGDRGGPDAGVLDGGLPHYEGGGVIDTSDDGIVDAPESGGVSGIGDAAGGGREATATVSLFDRRIGAAESRTVAWDDVTVVANGTPITGLSFFFAREAIGAKLVCPEADFAVGETVELRLTR
ncbi:hypothetical protein M0R88_08585 [Halorussus gelatinilyticus]|uniref:M23 family metallopeptidase n=1 Tax=Halorussus gelatinilyticus TaxID=2937524 RepID=A0A8U0INC8_9EURY|nr:hypothetical protein [Halorussus gelatinilyticus]UPW02135.1 hypothetical protein M0R88_08585 [Halorussus gelatinilyticus]